MYHLTFRLYAFIEIPRLQYPYKEVKPLYVDYKALYQPFYNHASMACYRIAYEVIKERLKRCYAVICLYDVKRFEVRCYHITMLLYHARLTLSSTFFHFLLIMFYKAFKGFYACMCM